MAIGDNHNDVEMLEFAGHPVIMGNASAELRARGYAVTLGNGECGVAAAAEAAISGEWPVLSASMVGRKSLANSDETL
jgi:hydroxymethylpyrimidine pyrophosphatase-like HAD family hydrolase